MKEWKKWPYFPMYSKDLLSSQAFRQMDDTQQGWYLKLLVESWECERPCFLPRDERSLMKLANVTQPEMDAAPEVHKWWRERFRERWDFVIAQFRVSGDCLYSPRLLEEYDKRNRYAEQNSLAGKASAESRRAAAEWKEGGDEDDVPPDEVVMHTFERFKELYPKRGDVMLLQQEWVKVVKRDNAKQIWEKIVADIKQRLAPGGEWTTENGRYIPKAVKYVREQQWNDLKIVTPKKPVTVKENILQQRKMDDYNRRHGQA